MDFVGEDMRNINFEGIATTMTIMMLITIVCTFVLLMISFENSITDLSTLESQSCHTIKISDKFTSVVGSGFSTRTIYFITSNNTTYNLLISTPEEIQKFRNINKTVDVKTYKNYAGFCDYALIKGDTI